MMNVVRIDQLELPELSPKSAATLITIMQALDRDAAADMDSSVRKLANRIHELEQLVWSEHEERKKHKSFLARVWSKHA